MMTFHFLANSQDFTCSASSRKSPQIPGALSHRYPGFPCIWAKTWPKFSLSPFRFFSPVVCVCANTRMISSFSTQCLRPRGHGPRPWLFTLLRPPLRHHPQVSSPACLSTDQPGSFPAVPVDTPALQVGRARRTAVFLRPGVLCLPSRPGLPSWSHGLPSGPPPRSLVPLIWTCGASRV